MGAERTVDLTEEKKDGCKMNGRSEKRHENNGC